MASYSQNNFYYKNNLSDKTIGSPHNQGDVPIYNDYLFYGLELCKRNPSSNQNNYYVNVSNVNSNVNYSEELDLSLSNLENSKPSLNELFDNLTNIIGSTLFNDYLDNKLHGYNTTWQNPYTYMKAYKLLDEISNITYELWPGTLIGKRSDNGYYSPVTPNNTVETGESVNLINAGNPPVGYKFQYSRDNNSWSNTIPTIQSVRGTYTTYWRLIENGSESKPLLISKVTTTIAEPDTIIVYDTDYTMPVAKQGLIYNGSEQQLLIDGSCEYGVFTYGYNNGAQGMPIQSITATNASTYQIDWRLVLRDGYVFENGTTFKIGTITCIIGKAQGSLDAETTAIIVGYNNDAIAGSIIDEKPVRTYFSWEGDGTIEFTSSNENVARIYNNYIYVYNREGIATLTARITNGSNYYYGSSPSDGFDEVFIDLTVDGQIETLYDNDVTINPTTYVYDGTAKKPSVTVIHNENTLVKDTDYTVTYEDNINVSNNAKCKITGKGDYTGEITKPFTITQKSISDVTITLNQSSYTYNGSEHKPTPTVKDGTKTLTLNTDYFVSYINNINAGTATCMITGNGNYTGSKGQPFTINRATLTSADIRITSNYDNVIYEGAPLTLFKLINNKHINNESILVYERGSAGEASSSELGWAMQNYTNQAPTGSRFHSLGESSGEFKTYTGEGTWYIYYCVDDPNYNRYPTSNYLYATSTIQSEQSLLTSAPVGNMNLTYNDTVQDLLTNVGSTSDGHLEYNTNDWGWGTTLPVSTYVGEYTIKYRIVRNNGRIVEDDSWVTTAKINKASGSISCSTSNLEYNSADLYSSAGARIPIYDYFTIVGDPNEIKYTTFWESGYVGNHYDIYYDEEYQVIDIGAGIDFSDNGSIIWHFKFYVDPYKETNYNYSPDEATLTITIFQSTISEEDYQQPYGNDSLTYNGSNQTLISGGSWANGSKGTFKYSLDNANWTESVNELKGKNAGTYTVYWYIESNNYVLGANVPSVDSPASFDVTINKATITNADITSPTAKTGLTYNTNAQTLINAGSITGNKGTIKYSVNSSNISNFSTTIPTGTNAGTYTIRWYIEPNDNYELDSSLPSSTNTSSFTVQINKANIIGGNVTTVPNLTYNGGTQGLFNITSPSNGDSNIKLYIAESSTENIDGLLSQNPTITVTTVPTNYTQSVYFTFTTQGGQQTANRSFICQAQEIQSRSLRINAGTNVLYYYFNDANNNYNVTSIRKVEGIIEQADGGFFLNSGDSSNPLSIDVGASVEYMDWDVDDNYYYDSDSSEYTVTISGNNGGADNNIATIEYVSGNSASAYRGIKITGVSAGTGTFNLLFTPSNTNYAPETLIVYFSIVQAQQVQNNIRYSIYSTDVTYPIDLDGAQLNATVDEGQTLRIKFIDDNNNNISDQITVNVDGNSSTAVTCLYVGDVTLNGELYKKFNITGVEVPRLMLHGDEPKLILTTNATNNYMAKTITIYLNVNPGTRTLYHDSSADLWFGSPNSFENVGDKVTAVVEIHNKYGNKITDVERINTSGFSVVFNNPSNFDYSNYFSIGTKVFNEQTCTWHFTVTCNNAMSLNNQTAIANMVQLTIEYFDKNYTADDLQINFPVNIGIQVEA